MTPRLTPLSWRKLVVSLSRSATGKQVSEAAISSLKSPVWHVRDVPKYDQIGLDIITNLIRTAGITREAFLALLDLLKTGVVTRRWFARPC